MMNRRNAALALTTLAAGLATGFSGCGAAVPTVLKIGLLVPQTGPHAGRGIDLLRGATMAANEINAGNFTIDGKPVAIEIVSYDDKGEPDGSVQGAHELVEAGVVGVIGPVNTPQAVKAIPVIAESGRLHLFTATATNLHELGHGNTFRLLANDELQARALASFVHETLHAQRIAVLYEPTDYGSGLNKTLLETFALAKRSVAFSTAIEAKGGVPQAVAEKIKAENADVVILLGRDMHLRGLFAALQSVGHTKLAVVGTNTIRNRNIAAEPIPVTSLYATATAIDAQEFANGKVFVKSFETAFKQGPMWGAHYAYDAVYAVINAAKSEKSVVSSKLIAHLKDKDPNTRVNDQMRFTSSGEQRHASIAVYRAELGAWEMQMRSSQW